MINNVSLQYFKRFEKQEIDLSGNIILAGPNNSGKTTLLQAIAVWSLALSRWLSERGPSTSSKAQKHAGVAITRKDFTAIPLSEMNLLWKDCSTALLKRELSEEQSLGQPRILKIRLDGEKKEKKWSLTFEFRYQSKELVYVKPSDETPLDISLLQQVKDLNIIHVPPFSGIGAEEAIFQKEYQDVLIGQGRPGEILRNILVELHKNKKNEWTKLTENVNEIFGYELLPPRYEGRPFIDCQYRPGTPNKSIHYPSLDIATAGSGFLQVVMLLGFFYARPASILLLDEPDAHLHVILQKQVYDMLRKVAQERGCQLVIATHSEVLVDSTSPESILSFFKNPHKLNEIADRDQIREALKRLTSLDILNVEQAQGVLYLEDDSSFNLLREWARVLKHPLSRFFHYTPFYHTIKGCHPREARDHYFALSAIKSLPGVLILDGDNRNLPQHDLATNGLTILRWERYEIENYLVHPEILDRFIRTTNPDLFTATSAERGKEYLQNTLPPIVFRDPLNKHEYLNRTPASKEILPGFFNATGINLTKNEYYQVAAQMLPTEIPDEVKEKLDTIYNLFY
ncbi:MAG: ATP-dependent nuclease [Dehalococcoidales bacterium]